MTIEELLKFLQDNPEMQMIIDGKLYDNQAAQDYLSKWPKKHITVVINFPNSIKPGK